MTGKVAWKEGLALLPQHFQRADESAREDLAHGFGTTPSRSFGFTRLRLDDSQLTGFNTLEVKSCAGFFQGGIRFDSEIGSGPSLRRELPSDFSEGNQKVTAYVAMPAPSEGKANLGDDGAAFREFRSDLRDAATGRSPRSVGLMAPSLSIRFSTDNNDGFVLLPVCQLVRGRQGAPVAAEDFHPTVLDIHAAPRLVDNLRTLVNHMRNRCLELERQNPTIDPQGMRQWLEVVHLRSSLPGVDYFVQNREIHPERVFVHLLQLAGGLSYTRGTDAPSTAYDHNAMSSSLGALIARLFQILSSEIQTDNLVVPMTRQQPLLFVAKPEQDALKSGKRFHIAIRSSVPVEKLVQLMAHKAKVASMSRLQPIIMSALPGIEARMAPPPAFFRATGQICFELVPNGPLWQTLLEEGVLGVYTPVDLDVTSIELLIEGG